MILNYLRGMHIIANDTSLYGKTTMLMALHFCNHTVPYACSENWKKGVPTVAQTTYIHGDSSILFFSLGFKSVRGCFDTCEEILTQHDGLKQSCNAWLNRNGYADVLLSLCRGRVPANMLKHTVFHLERVKTIWYRILWPKTVMIIHHTCQSNNFCCIFWLGR